jgi:hypothetical protein
MHGGMFQAATEAAHEIVRLITRYKHDTDDAPGNLEGQ